MEQDGMSMDLPGLLRALKKNMLALLVCTLWGALAAFIISLYVLPTQYQAVATLVVKTGSQEAEVREESLATARQLVGTCAVLLTNDSLLGELIETHQLEDSVDDLRKRIEAKGVDQTQVLRVAARDEDPATALSLLDTLVERAPILLAGAVKGSVVEVITPPWVDAQPVAPNLKQALVVGGALGFLACLVGVLARNMMKNSFTTEEDVEEKLGLPVLASVPAVRCHPAESPAHGEAFHYLKAVLRGLPQRENCRVLLVTSAVPGEGSSSVAAGLARVLAPEGRTLLLDADLRRVGTEAFGGLASVLRGTLSVEDGIRHLGDEGYWRLAAGGPVDNAAQMLDSSAMAALLQMLGDQFDQIIVDTPAVLAAADAALLGHWADAGILVVRAKKGADFRQGQRAVRLLQASGTVLAGAVINGGEKEKIKGKGRYAHKHGYS